MKRHKRKLKMCMQSLNSQLMSQYLASCRESMLTTIIRNFKQVTKTCMIVNANQLAVFTAKTVMIG